MTFFDTHPPLRRIWPAITAGIALFIAGAIAVGGVNVLGVRAGFGFIPLTIIAVWPRQANTLLSILFVFLAGVFTDWATGGLVGQSALVFTVIWGVLRPELRSEPYSLVSIILFWLATCGLAMVLIGVTGWFVYGVRPDFASFGRQLVVATICLPLIVLLRGVLAGRLFATDDWGG